jgi:hypothetical protein
MDMQQVLRVLGSGKPIFGTTDSPMGVIYNLRRTHKSRYQPCSSFNFRRRRHPVRDVLRPRAQAQLSTLIKARTTPPGPERLKCFWRRSDCSARPEKFFRWNFHNRMTPHARRRNLEVPFSGRATRKTFRKDRKGIATSHSPTWLFVGPSRRPTVKP